MVTKLHRRTGFSKPIFFSWLARERSSTYLRLNHVVPLGPEYRHVTVYVHCVFVFDSFQHGVDNDEAAGPTDTSTEEKGKQCYLQV